MPNNSISNDNIAIKVSNLTKIYHLYDKPQDRLKEALNPFKKSYHHDFYAMNDVSFEIKKGETVGIIGKNGAGKSTLLKMITGVLTPSSGSIEVHGKIASLLELGAGFNPEMTGLENIYLNGTLMGFSHQEMATKVDAILEFADIGEFIEQPVKMYSSGMFARLAFAVSINVEPDILIVDEALAVGDSRFQAKCIRRMEEIALNGATIIFVSHDIQSINKFCNHVIWIDKGKIHERGKPTIVLENFMSYMTYGLETIRNNTDYSKENVKVSSSEKMPMIDISLCDSFGERQAFITQILFIDNFNVPKTNFIQGDEITFLCDFYTTIDLFQVGVGVLFKDTLNNEVLTFNSYMYDSSLKTATQNTTTRVTIKFKVPKIFPREYTVTVALSEGTLANHIQQHWVHDATVINIQSKDDANGSLITLYKEEIEYSYEQI